MTTTILNTRFKTTESKVETKFFATKNFLAVNSWGSKAFYKAGDPINATRSEEGLVDHEGYGFTLTTDNGETTKSSIPWEWVKVRKFKTVREYKTTELEIHE